MSEEKRDSTEVFNLAGYSQNFVLSNVDPDVMALLTGQTWAFNSVLLDMGAFYQFDYTDAGGTIKDRLTRCYELAAKAFLDWPGKEDRITAERVPHPVALVHGSWHGPDAPKRIDHAWVVLSDGNVWEPISMTLCDTFYIYTRALNHRTFTEAEAKINMITTQHYGPWL